MQFYVIALLPDQFSFRPPNLEIENKEVTKLSNFDCTVPCIDFLSKVLSLSDINVGSLEYRYQFSDRVSDENECERNREDSPDDRGVPGGALVVELR